MEEYKFKHGDWVKMWYEGKYYFGEATVCKENETKIMFIDYEIHEYWYYSNALLQLVKIEDYGY